MNTTTVSQGGLAGALAMALVVIINGILNHFKIQLTDDETNALVTILIISIHSAMANRKAFIPDRAATPAAPAAPSAS